MRRSHIALVSLSISLLAAWLTLRVVYGPRPLLRIVSTRQYLFPVLEERAREVGHPIEGDDLLRIPIDEDTAAVFFPANTATVLYQYDPLVYSRPKPNPAPAFTAFPEHPDGGFYLHINTLGLREDHEVSVEKRDLRVLVGGDSHTYGLCNTAETFSKVLEGLIADELPGRHVEVLNGGGGYYNFYNYLGNFERLSFLDPDVFVLVAYGGNDFSGCMPLQRYFHARAPPAMEPHRVTADQPDGAGPQEVLQTAYFLNNPEDEPVAVRTAVAIVAEVHRQCLARGVDLLAVYLPSAYGGQPEIYAEGLRQSSAALGVEPQELAAGDRIAEQWLAALRESGMRTLDLRPAFRSVEQPMFWRTDLHLNVAGHELVAQQLLAEVVPLLEARSTAQSSASDH